MRHVRHTYTNASITGAGNTPQYDHIGTGPLASTVAVVVTVGAVSGTTPSWTPTLQVSVDGVNWVDIQSLPAITAAGTFRMVVQNVIAPYVRLNWVAPSGTTPNFQTVTAHIVFPAAS